MVHQNKMEGKTAGVCVAAAVAAGLYIYFGPTSPPRKRNQKGLSAGLYNLGNTCFMNSVLQGLASLSSFVSWIEDFFCWKCRNEKGKRLGGTLAEMMKELNTDWDDNDTVLSAGPILQALQLHGWVIPTDQQDAYEFFQVLSSTLDDELGELPAILDLRDIISIVKTKESSDGSAAHRNKVPLAKSCTKSHIPFRGLLASQLVCKTCRFKCPVKFDGCDSISLSLPSRLQVGLTLEDLLRKFVCSETVDSVECKGCGKEENNLEASPKTKSTFIKRLTLGKLPQCMCIHIQRTYWHSNGIPYKNNAYIKFAEYLNLGPFMYDPVIQRKSMSELSLAKINLQETKEEAETESTEGNRTPASTKPATPGVINVLAELRNSFPSGLLSPISFSRQNSESRLRTVYRLTAVTAHRGDVDEGHYITYRRFHPAQDDTGPLWLYTSDELVEAASHDQVFSCCAYMLFYERCPAGFEDYTRCLDSLSEFES